MQDETSTSEPIDLRERLKGEEISSETVTGNPKSRSVYDFLYHDARRIASFLAQFEGHGVAGSVKTSTHDEQGSIDKKSGGGGGGVLGFAQGSLSLERSASLMSREVTERQFDPLWSNARRFLDFIDSEGLLQRDILKALLGQLVLVRGPLVMIDPAFLQATYTDPSFKAQLRGAIDFKAVLPAGSNEKQKNQLFDFFITMLARMPHITQVHFLPAEFSAWASLDPNSLVPATSDILLKNGALIPGTWSMVGIMDAFPRYRLHPDTDGKPPNYDLFIQNRLSAPVPKLMSAFAPIIRDAIGRPDDYYGLTPIVIFREVGPNSSDHSQAV